MRTRPFRRWLWCPLLVLATPLACAADEPKAKPPTVPVSHPVEREVTDYEDFTGRTAAVESVDLRARVTGYLTAVRFKDGSAVKKGDVLFEIDPRPYQAAFDEAKAKVALAEARLKLAEADLERAKRLLASGGVSREDYDRIVAARTEAQLAARRARAGLEVAQLNLAFTRVTAPIDGQIGRRLLGPGNLVKADETMLATLVSRDPMYVYFDIDERTLLRMRKEAAQGKFKVQDLPVHIALQGETGFPHAAKMDFLNIRVNPNTGTLTGRAVLPNPAGLLVPGLFVRVRLVMGQPYRALLVPVRAVATDQGQKFVYIVNNKNVVEKRLVSLGQAQDDGLWVVRQGLRPADLVVVDGLQRVRPGMTVGTRIKQNLPTEW